MSERSGRPNKRSLFISHAGMDLWAELLLS